MSLYEDTKIVATVPEKMLGKGHVVVATKDKPGNIQEMSPEDFQHLMYGASFAATALFENMQAHGTNIILNTGNALEKEDVALKVDVLARWGDDNLNLLWKPKQIDQSELESIAKKIKDKADMIGIEKTTEEPVDLDKKPEKLEPEEKKEKSKKETKEETKEPEKETKNTKKEEVKEKFQESKETQDEKKKEEPEDKQKKTKEEESYLIRQLRRVP